MRAKKLANLLLVVFLSFMIFFTVFARKIYESSLPLVSAQQVTWIAFPIEIETDEGEILVTTRKVLAVPMVTFHGNSVFLCEEDEPYCRAFEREVEIGENYDGFVEVLNGLNAGMLVITESNREISDGERVKIQE